MIPKSISEKLMFNTVRLETVDNSSTGTGFFFGFKIKDDYYPVIITNKHVVNYNSDEKMKFYLHLKENDGSSKESIQVIADTKWIFHSTEDLCFCFAYPIFEAAKKLSGKDVFYSASDELILAVDSKLEKLSALEEIVMVGYPIGLMDQQNNFPIFRKGFTATHPFIDFNGTPTGVIDAACFPGSSGSPIYILNESGFRDKYGNMYIGESRIILLGVLHSGPVYNIKGELTIEKIPTNNCHSISVPNVNVMINLGYYAKAKTLLEFKKYIESTIN